MTLALIRFNKEGLHIVILIITLPLETVIPVHDIIRFQALEWRSYSFMKGGLVRMFVKGNGCVWWNSLILLFSLFFVYHSVRSSCSRLSFYIFVFLYIYVSTYLSISLLINPSNYLFAYHSLVANLIMSNYSGLHTSFQLLDSIIQCYIFSHIYQHYDHYYPSLALPYQYCKHIIGVCLLWVLSISVISV